MSPSIGMNLLATMLRSKGHDVTVLDPLMLALRKASSGLALQHLLTETIETKHIRLVGISAVLQTRIMGLAIARLVKALDPTITVVLGGAVVPLLGHMIFKHWGPAFDCLVFGEGEHTLPQIVSRLEKGRSLNGIPGVGLPASGTPTCMSMVSVRAPVHNLDRVPHPDYSDYIPLMPNRRLSTVSILSSRGCPYNCAFCGSRAMWGGVRYRSPKDVVNEIRELRDKYYTEEIRFHDDTFGGNRIQTSAILHKLATANLGVRLYAHSRVDVVTSNFLALFRKAGGEYIYYGLESGSARMRKLLGKASSDEKVIEICQMTKKAGLQFGFFLLLGYPTETVRDLKKTYALLQQVKPDDIACSILKIQPGTRLYPRALSMGIIKDADWVTKEDEYFTFVSPRRRELLLGVQILFYELFSHAPLKSASEKNNDLIHFSGDAQKMCELRDKAAKWLGIEITKRNRKASVSGRDVVHPTK